ncbi:MAG: ubiquinol-cytochrome c reductase iron-sulfur subunit [Thermodesulfobacteriota bacterium]
MPSKDAPHNNRRELLLSGWGILRTAALLTVLYPALRFLEAVLPRRPRQVLVHKRLANGAYHVDRDFILFDEGGRSWAVSRVCTHLGCRLNYRQEENLLVCPCHSSKFTLDGTRVAGPATRNLAAYPVKRLADDKGYLITI